MFISETLLQNFAVNKGLCMWRPVIYEEIRTKFCNGLQLSNAASSVKADEFCCPQSIFFKKLRWAYYFERVSEKIL